MAVRSSSPAVCTLAAALALALSPVATAQQPDATTGSFATPAASARADSLTTVHREPVMVREINPRHNPLASEAGRGEATWDRTDTPVDPLVGASSNRSRTAVPLNSWESTDATTGCGGCSPPDMAGDVGPNHYVHMVNATKVAVFSKDGSETLAGPFSFGDLWDSGPCSSNAGDPIVVYDELADRFVLSQFAQPTHMCFAVSQTPDPTGAYHVYTFDVGAFPDYFKLGVWPDAYYMSANEATYTAYAFDRDKMLAGETASFVKFTSLPNLALPADIDGSEGPAEGTPGLFYTFLDETFHTVSNDMLRLYEMVPDFATPENSTFDMLQEIELSNFSYTVCGFFNFNCLKQLETTQTFDTISEWPLQRFPYRNFGDHESLLGVFGIGGGLGEKGAALRWFELRNSGEGWELHQEGTHDPGDGHDRAVGSIAMDQQGNIALGYTTTSSTIHPRIDYVSRKADDPYGTMGSELTLVAGANSNTHTARWGDYSALSIDPADGCTFFFTSLYYDDSPTSWQTRIGSFKVDGCEPPVPALFEDDFESEDTLLWTTSKP